MIAATASGHTAQQILWEIPLAQAYQFAAAWLEMNGTETRAIEINAGARSAFEKIRGGNT